MQVISWILLKKVEKQFSYWMTEIEYCICSSMIKPQTPCFSGDCPGNGVFFYDLPKSLIWRAGQTPELRGFSRSAILLRNQVLWLRYAEVVAELHRRITLKL